nr:hypothetical protein C17F4.4 - Caenorhabditis elegans [Caenorhabditis elegans]
MKTVFSASIFKMKKSLFWNFFYFSIEQKYFSARFSPQNQRFLKDNSARSGGLKKTRKKHTEKGGGSGQYAANAPPLTPILSLGLSKNLENKINNYYKFQLQKDDSNCIFIDRSPKHFDIILNFLRDGDVDLPEQEKEINEVKREAQFYLLEELVDLCHRKINTKIRVLISGTEKIEFYTKNDKPRLLIKYPEKNLDESPILDIDWGSLMEKYRDQFHIAFAPQNNCSLSANCQFKSVKSSIFLSIGDVSNDCEQFIDNFLKKHFPIHIFGGYCILLKTPKIMKSVKWALFNLHFWSSFLDISISLLAQPFLCAPVFAGYQLGILSWIGVPTDISELTIRTLYMCKLS